MRILSHTEASHKCLFSVPTRRYSVSPKHKKHRRVPFILYVVLCVVLFSSCGSGSGGTLSPTPTPYKPFLALHICGDNTASYPQQFLQEAARNIADRIDSDVS